MVPRHDGTRYKQTAVVNPAKCVGCGICVGACDSAGILLGDPAGSPLRPGGPAVRGGPPRAGGAARRRATARGQGLARGAPPRALVLAGGNGALRQGRAPLPAGAAAMSAPVLESRRPRV